MIPKADKISDGKPYSLGCVDIMNIISVSSGYPSGLDPNPLIFSGYQRTWFSFNANS